MTASNFLQLVRRGLRLHKPRFRIARFGVALSVFFLVLGLGAVRAVSEALRPTLEKLFPERKVLVAPKALEVAFVKVNAKRIDDDALARIRALPGVAAAHGHMPIQFPIHAVGKLGPMAGELATEIVVHGVDRALVADGLPETEPFDWTLDPNGGLPPGEPPVPVVVSAYFLDLYNAGLAETNGLPQLTEKALFGRRFRLVLGESTFRAARGERRREVECRVVGLTRDPQLAGVAVPLSAVRSFNRWWRNGEDRAEFTLLQVETISAGVIDAVSGEIGKMGFGVRHPGAAFERWRWAARAGLALLGGFGAALLLLALGNVASTFALVLSERRGELGLLRALGATRGRIRALLLVETIWIAASAGAVGAVGALLVGRLSRKVLQDLAGQFVSLADLGPIPGVGIAALTWAAAVALAVAATLPAALRATRGATAHALRDL